MNELQYAIGFTDDDLAINRQGRLSQSQREKLIARQRSSRRVLTGVACSVFAMVVIAGFSGTFGILVFGIIALIVAIMGCVEYLIGYQTYTRDLSRNQVEAIQGVVHYVWRGESALGIETSPSGIMIGDEQFLLLEDQARSFSEGGIYVLYYAPATHTLLAAERVHLQDVSIIEDAEIAYYEAVPDSDEQSTIQF